MYYIEHFPDEQGHPKTLSADKKVIWEAWMPTHFSEGAATHEDRGEIQVEPFYQYEERLMPKEVRDNLELHRSERLFDCFEVWAHHDEKWGQVVIDLFSPPRESMLVGVRKGYSGKEDSYAIFSRWSEQPLTPFEEITSQLTAEWRKTVDPKYWVDVLILWAIVTLVTFGVAVTSYGITLRNLVISAVSGLACAVLYYFHMKRLNSEDRSPLMRAINKKM